MRAMLHRDSNWLVVVCCILISLHSGVVSVVRSADPEHGLDIFPEKAVSRLAVLHDLDAEAEHQIFYGPARMTKEEKKALSDAFNGSEPHEVSGTLTRTERLTAAGDRYRFEYRVKADDPKKVAGITGEVVFISPERFERLVTYAQTNTQLGSVSNDRQLSPEWVFDVALGLRLWGGTAPLEAHEVRAAVVKHADGNTILTLTDKKGLVHEFVYVNDGSVSAYRVRRNEQVRVEFQYRDFMKVGTTMLPQEITILQISDGRLKPSHHFKVSVYKLGEQRKKNPQPLMIWPKGTRVLDERIGRTLLIEDKDRSLTDQDIFDRIAAKSATRPARTNDQPPVNK